MRKRLPVTILVAFAMAASVLPAFASDSADRRTPREVISAQDHAPVNDFENRASAGLGSGASSAQATIGQDVVVHGGGWGHGIGMSQWGAQAMALAGSSHEQILGHFYTGVQFGAIAPEGNVVQWTDQIHVGVGPNRISVSFTPQHGSGEVCVVPAPDDSGSGAGGDEEPEEQCFTAQQGEQWFLYGTQATGNPGETCLLTRGSTEVMAEAATCEGTLTWDNQPNTRMHFPGIGRTYARGSVRFTPVLAGGEPNGRFHVSVVSTMDEYLYGLGEVPNTWHPEALKAQVLAARSFALYRIFAVTRVSPGVHNFGQLRSDCACQLLATTVDQAYLGWHTNGLTEGDNNATNGTKWRQAVDQTSGKVMWHTFQGPSRALEAYYFSSTGGATENNEDRWGGTAYPYLRSVPDPGATAWSKGFSYQSFASALGMGTVTWVDIPERYVSGRPKSIVFQGTTLEGTTTSKTFTPGQLVSALGLTSQTVHNIDGFLPEGADRVGIHNPTTGQWTLRSPSGSQFSFYYGDPGDMAIFGDWDGDGIATVGLYRQSDGYVYLRNSNDTGFADKKFYFGIPGDIPVVGDFNGNGKDTVSIYRPSEQRFYITNQLGNDNQAFVAEYSFVYGNPGDKPFAGDWNGNGIDTPGLRRPSDGYVYLRNSNSSGVADMTFFYGIAGDVIFSGDWNADGKDGLGIYRPSNGTVFLRNSLSTGSANITYQMGTPIHRAVAGAY